MAELPLDKLDSDLGKRLRATLSEADAMVTIESAEEVLAGAREASESFKRSLKNFREVLQQHLHTAPLPPSQFRYVAAHLGDEGDWEFQRSKGLSWLDPEQPVSGPIHVHFDLDALDPAAFPHVAYPEGELALDAGADEIVILLDRARDQDERLVQQLLVSVCLRHDREESAGDWRDARLAYAVLDAAIDQRLDVLVAEDLGARGQRLRGLPGDGARVVGL